MERFVLDKQKYMLLRSLDLPEMENEIIFHDDLKCIDTANADLLLVIISENISIKELENNQEECNEYGRALYELYDEILKQ